jgi:FAD:protein FMN transferase
MPEPTRTTSATPGAPAAYGQAQWRALGTYVQLVVAGEQHLEAARRLAVRRLDDVDRTCSRFRDDSDLVRANRNAGRWTPVDPLLSAAVAAALSAAEASDGHVDPTLGHSITAAGYDRTFAELGSDGHGPADVPAPPPLREAWRHVEVDPDGAVLVPAGAALDLGATGKAFAADLIAGEIGRTTGCVLSLGGDVAVGAPDGAPPRTPPWRVSLSEVPEEPPAVQVELPAGGMATSTVLARRWRRGGAVVHHLLDPATGRSVDPVWRTASVVAPTCLEANTASTAAIVIGEHAPAWLATLGVAARLVDGEGAVAYVGNWNEEAL